MGSFDLSKQFYSITTAVTILKKTLPGYFKGLVVDSVELDHAPTIIAVLNSLQLSHSIKERICHYPMLIRIFMIIPEH